MDRHVALLAAATLAALGLAACGGGGGNPGVCSGSFEVCSEGRDAGEVVITTNGTGTAGIGAATDSNPTAPTTTSEVSPSTIPINAVGQ